MARYGSGWEDDSVPRTRFLRTEANGRKEQ